MGCGRRPPQSGPRGERPHRRRRASGIARSASASNGSPGPSSKQKPRIGTADLHAVTMTGELADTFSSRVEGVETAVGAGGARARTGARVALCRPGWLHCAAGRASTCRRHRIGQLVCQRFARRSRVHSAALFIDMGSTTTDLVPVVDGAIAARGYTDAERLAAGELVYTGLVRSFVMAVADRAPFAGTLVGADQRILRQHGRRASHSRAPPR